MFTHMVSTIAKEGTFLVLDCDQDCFVFLYERFVDDERIIYKDREIRDFLSGCGLTATEIIRDCEVFHEIEEFAIFFLEA